MPPLTDEVIEPGSSQATEDDESVPSHAFGGGHVDLSLLLLYLNHIVRHIWDGEVKLVGFILFKLHLLLYYKFLTMIYFSV